MTLVNVFYTKTLRLSQAMDIGAPAILFLIDAWEGHLTPPEAAGIADKASSGRDVHTVRAAAELALSVLPHAHALNYNEIQRAVLQCKEQSDAMLERACLTVEAAAKGGGVYPEVLYTVARYWHELYLRQASEESEPLLEEPQYRAPPPVALPVPYPLPYPFTYHPYPPPIYQLQYGGAPAPHGVAGAHAQYALPPYFVRGLVPHAPLTHAAHAPHAPHAPHPVHPPPMPVNVNVQHPAPIPPPMPLAGAHAVSALPAGPPQPPLPQAQLRRLLAAYRVGMLALETQARRVHDDRPQNKFGRNPPYGEHVKWLLRISKRLGAQYLHQFCVCAVNSVVSPFVLYELCVESAHWLARGGPHHLVMQHLRGTLAPLVQKCQQMYIQCIHQKLYHLTPVEYEEFVSIVLSARTAFQLTPEGNTQFKEWLASLRSGCDDHINQRNHLNVAHFGRNGQLTSIVNLIVVAADLVREVLQSLSSNLFLIRRVDITDIFDSGWRECKTEPISRSKSCKKDLWTQLNAALQTNGK
ncbi:hypothetical protein MSG28_002860 [Choristoneura fumiferana]|uniref:Uncharacterized protein n=1 Tax=Choristoneura fumiferana TaxID=7141 RepID=A0ACC0JJG8_CHOFU|nr:hypothetical protein MSG28_002860 [Choristoneura fumiferana]